MTTDSTKKLELFKAGTTPPLKQPVQGGTHSTVGQNEQAGKNDFLRLLLTQLNQSQTVESTQTDQFSINPSQMDHLDQLFSMGAPVAGTGASDISTLASYLGHEVTFDADTVQLKGGDAGTLKLNLPQDASDVGVDLLNNTGERVGTYNFGALPSGEHRVSLSGVALPNGEYQFRVNAREAHGSTFTAEAHTAGVVTGFVPGPDPVLMVGSREVKPGSILGVGSVGEEGSKGLLPK